jgi:hypothetical protein
LLAALVLGCGGSNQPVNRSPAIAADSPEYRKAAENAERIAKEQKECRAKGARRSRTQIGSRNELMKSLTTLTTALVLTQTAAAHFVWIGSTIKDGKLVVTSGLGEPGEYDKKFADRIKQTKYWTEDASGKTTPLTMPFDAAAGEYRNELSGPRPRVVIGFCDYGIFQRPNSPASRLMYSAKRIVEPSVGWKDSAPRKELRIELLAEFTADKVVFRVIHHGKPLANAEIKLFGPSDDNGVVTTNVDGGAEWKLKSPGEYSCYVGTSVPKAGEVNGKKYESERDYATLTFSRPNGKAVAAFPALPEAFSSFGAAATDGFIYVYGGHKGRTHNYSTATVHGKFRRLNLASPEIGWEELPEGPIGQGLALVAHGGLLYRLGGMQPKNGPSEQADNVSSAKCAVFDPKSRIWKDIPPFPAPRSSFDAVVVGDRIYVFGGWNQPGRGKESEWRETGLVLDLRSKPLAWREVLQPFQRRALNLAAADGKVFVVAGFTPDEETDQTVDVFDTATEQWSKTAPLPGAARNGFSPAACGMEGAVFASPADGVVYRLDVKMNLWSEIGKLERKRIVHRIVPAGGGRLVVLGGANGGDNVAEVEVVPAGN